MYQINLSVDKSKSHWYRDTEKLFSKRIRSCGGIVAAKENGGRLDISVACENKDRQKIISTIREHIGDMFLTTVKFEYLRSVLALPGLKPEAYKLLLHTLAAFDRETERDIIYSVLNFGDNIALDGVFYFRLAELRKRWDDIAQLAVNNAVYLNNDETLNDLLRFLISAISPKINRIEVVKRNGGYNIKGDGDGRFEYRVCSQEQLMLYLINIAPTQLTLCGSFDNDSIVDRLTAIFDVKSENFSRVKSTDFNG